LRRKNEISLLLASREKLFMATSGKIRYTSQEKSAIPSQENVFPTPMPLKILKSELKYN